MAYERLETLKESEKSKVYLVYDEEQHRMMVEKRLKNDGEVYRQLQGLEHPYLPKLYAVHTESDETVIYEEYITGGSIAAVSATEKQLARWFRELCDVLDFLHRRKIIHRDIKPSNLLIGGDGHIRLVDFDAAREEKLAADTDTRLLGTRGYAPPEQYGFAQSDQRTDVYALGVTFRELLGKSAKKARWRRVLKRCTAWEPKKRYRDTRRVKRAVTLGKVRRRVLYPLCGLILTPILLFTAVMQWAYVTNSDAREAYKYAMFPSYRRQVFYPVDMFEIRGNHDHLRRHPLKEGSNEYDALWQEYPRLKFIYTGFATEQGDALFGGFTIDQNEISGELRYREFCGLYTKDQHIPPEECGDYASAMWALYRLPVFNPLELRLSH